MPFLRFTKAFERTRNIKIEKHSSVSILTAFAGVLDLTKKAAK